MQLLEAFYLVLLVATSLAIAWFAVFVVLRLFRGQQ